MNHFFRRLACLVAVVALPMAGMAGAIVQGRSATDIYLSNFANTGVTIVSVTLPAAGSYAAVGRASVVNWTGLEDDTRCSLVLSGVPIDVSVATTGGVRSPSAAGIEAAARVTTTVANQMLSLQCSHDRTISGIKVDGGAELLVSDALPGPKGPVGPTGSRGIPGPAGNSGLPAQAKVAMCVSPNGTLPTQQTCTCASPSTGSPVITTSLAPTCAANGDAASCQATGLFLNGSHYGAACCTCKL